MPDDSKVHDSNGLLKRKILGVGAIVFGGILLPWPVLQTLCGVIWIGIGAKLLGLIQIRRVKPW